MIYFIFSMTEKKRRNNSTLMSIKARRISAISKRLSKNRRKENIYTIETIDKYAKHFIVICNYFCRYVPIPDDHKRNVLLLIEAMKHARHHITWSVSNHRN